jgi:hypothetical protein
MRSVVALLTISLAAAYSAEAPQDEHVIIIIRRPPPEVVEPTVIERGPPAHSAPTQRGDVYRVVFDHPEQTFLDSDRGPVPLYTDVVFDGNGEPHPRFPAVYAKNLFDNPTEESALAYLEQGKVRMRRIKEVTNLVEVTAAKHGYVVPSDFAADPTVAEEPDRYNVTKPNKSDNPKDWGQPILSPEQASRNGLDKDDIPLTPRYGYDVEIWYIWDHRDERSIAALQDFAAFGWDIVQADAKVNVKTISLDTDSKKLVQMLDYLQWRGFLVHKLENYTDYTNLRRSLHITHTPTYVFIDKRRGVIERWEGVTALQDLRERLMDFLGLTGDRRIWKPSPEWFVSDKDRQKFRDLNRETPIPVSSEPPPQNASPVQKASTPILPWRP